MESDFSIGANSANELMSPLLRLLPHLLSVGISVHDLPAGSPSAQGLDMADPTPESAPVAVTLDRVR
jgi:hypothetical protein